MTTTEQTQNPTTTSTDTGAVGTAPAADEEPLRVAMLVASVRAERVATALAQHVAASIRTRDVVLDVIDLAEHELPEDSLLEPGGGPATAIGERIEAADAYVVLTPEFNHSYPASLKRAIDWHYAQWMFAPAAIVAYGARGGALATEHLRNVFAELHVVTTRRTLAIAAPWQRMEDGGYTPDEGEENALQGMLDELLWWAAVLHDARRDRPFRR